MALLDVLPGFGRDATRKCDPLGPLVAELQDHVEILDATLTDNVDISTNTANIATLQNEVETTTTGLLDRVTSLETAKTADEADIATLQTEVETATTGLLDRVTALEASDTTDETHITQLQGSGTKLVPISFETGEVGAVKVYFPVQVTITKFRGFTTLALADTDAGTVTAKNSANSAMASGVLTFPASSVFGFQPTPAVPTTNNVVTAGSYIQLVTAKTTAGGTGFVEIEYTVTP